ncbi:hypothetical protein GCM10011531_27030 [Aquaticitalea lipolytica]|uniref:Uncharacterized protein n=2 Tax=Aquaticitalea lipolytica TaxID=1247562 RepID=A0A8J2TTB0_9FLAO|nr:hypothetical protein GCM10011531_27030 [Aquaticitalea lipolytica]
MKNMNRKEFTKGLLATIISYALMDSLFATNAFINHINPLTKHWAIKLNEYCSDLKKQTITPKEWQSLIDELYKDIELNDLIKFIDFRKLQTGFQYPDLGVNTKPVFFPKLDGLPENTVFIKKIFGMKKDRAIIPHGHSNMASAHLVLNGEMHLRHYEKIRKEGDNLIIKPTIDKLAKIGDSSSISDEKDNVHWFVANTDTAFTFDVIMLDLKGKATDIHNIDIFEKQNLSDGTMRVPILDVNTALKKYGKETHH